MSSRSEFAVTTVYDSALGTPKTEAGPLRQIPLSDSALRFIAEWKLCAKTTESDALVFATRLGRPISPNNVLLRPIFPACDALGIGVLQ